MSTRERSAPDATALATTTELVALAKKRLSADVWDFVVGGAETETTLLRNRYALDAIAFRPRVLRDVEQAAPRTEFLGAEQRLPVLLAPLASATDIHPDGALPLARAARRARCLLLLSSVAQTDIEAAIRAADGYAALQIYADGNDRWLLDLAKRGEGAGCTAVCLTVDVPHFGRRERSIHRRQTIAGRPFGKQRSGEANRARADWKLVKRLKRAVGVPLMVKGIGTAEDAKLALEHGVDVVYVSNHGGRQLDHGRGAIDLLAEVVATVRGKAEVVVDGGFMRGTDVLKAIAMGARMVGIGRLQALALGAAGEDGVVRLVDLLDAELTTTLKLLGVTSCRELDGSFLHPTLPVHAPGLLSALPLLDSLR